MHALAIEVMQFYCIGHITSGHDHIGDTAAYPNRSKNNRYAWLRKGVECGLDNVLLECDDGGVLLSQCQ